MWNVDVAMMSQMYNAAMRFILPLKSPHTNNETFILYRSLQWRLSNPLPALETSLPIDFRAVDCQKTINHSSNGTADQDVALLSVRRRKDLASGPDPEKAVFSCCSLKSF